MSISKAKREQVYKKFGGRCAYCGKAIEYKDMQVDHFYPKDIAALYQKEKGKSIDDMENLMPSCRLCNHYKRANGIETFRRYIEEIPEKLSQNYIYKVGVRYGNIVEQPYNVQFLYEILDGMELIDEEGFRRLKRGDRVYTEEKTMIIVENVYDDPIFGVNVVDPEGTTFFVGQLYNLKNTEVKNEN